MTPERADQIHEARQTYLNLSAEQQRDFLQQLRRTQPDLAADLEAALGQQPNPETIDYVSQAESAADQRTTDYHPANQDSDIPNHIGRYAIDSKLGEGGMGVVYRGRDPDLKRFLAVKVIKEGPQADADLCRRFLEEAQVMGQLQHPGVAPIHEIGTLDDGRPFFSMKQVEGHTLAELLRQRGDRRPACRETATGEPPVATELPRFLGIFEQICQTLAYAHSEGILHRDLKPDNVMVGAFGEVQVMDWGLAKPLGSREAEIGIRQAATPALALAQSREGTQYGVAMGTPAYMAPEQARGEITELDERCDVFGLGAILCVILTGKPPFASKTLGEVMDKAQQGDLTDALARLQRCGAEAELVDLCMKCLAPQKADRPRAAEAVAHAVTVYQEGVQEKLKQAEVKRAQAEVQADEERKRRQVERQRRWWATAAAVTVVLFVIGAATGLLLYQHVQATRSEEHARRLESIKTALLQAKNLRQTLHEKLAHDPGIFQMVNQPREWLARIEAAQSAWQRAHDLAKGTEMEVDQGLTQQITALRTQLRQDMEDYRLVQDLEQVREDKGLIVEGEFNLVGALDDYTKVFERVGVKVHQGLLIGTIERQPHAPMSKYLATALTDWALTNLVAESKQQQPKDNPLRRQLLKLARRLDPDPWMDQLRQPALWTDRKAVIQLVQRVIRAREEGQNPPTMTPNAFYVPAVLLHWHRYDPEAWLRQGVSAHRSDFWLAFTLANVLNQKEQWSQAVGFDRVAVALRPHSAVAHQNLGNTLYNLADWNEAFVAYKKAIDLAPNYYQVHFNLGLALWKRKDIDGAIAAYRKAIRLNPKNAKAYSHLGTILMENRDPVAGLVNLKKAVTLAPYDAKCHYNLGCALETKQNLNGAMTAYNKAIALDPNYVSAHTNLGSVLYAKGDLEGAMDAFNKAIALDPKQVTAHVGLGAVLTAKQDLKGALKSLNKAIALDPKLADAYVNLGAVLNAQHDPDGAITAYKKAIRLRPDDAKTYYNLGNALKAKQDLDGAIAAYEKAIRLDDDLAESHFNLGSTLHSKKDLDGAIRHYRKAIVLDPKHAKVHTNLGNALRAKNDLSGSVAAHQKAIALDPKDAKAHYNLGNALQAQNALDAAVTAYKKAIALDPNVPQFHNNLGIALALNRDLDGAVIAFKKALALDPNLVQARRNLQLMLRDPNRSPKPPSPKPKKTDPIENVVKGTLTATDPLDSFPLTKKSRHKVHVLELNADTIYQIDLHGDFDTFLRLENTKKKVLALNDDVTPPKDLNSRLIHQPKKTAKHRLVVTSFQPATGKYTLTVRQVRPAGKALVIADKLTKDDKTIRNKYTKFHKIPLTAGTPYTIDVESKTFDTFLVLIDPTGKRGLAQNNDARPGDTTRARIDFTPPTSGTYHVLVTSYRVGEVGDYRVRVQGYEPPNSKNQK